MATRVFDNNNYKVLVNSDERQRRIFLFAARSTDWERISMVIDEGNIVHVGILSVTDRCLKIFLNHSYLFIEVRA